jgi:hypothetical protein
MLMAVIPFGDVDARLLMAAQGVDIAKTGRPALLQPCLQPFHFVGSKCTGTIEYWMCPVTFSW